MDTINTSNLKEKIKKRARDKNLCVRLVLCGLFFFVFYLFSPPVHFSENTFVHIESGTSIQKIAEQLKEQSLIRSPLLFKIFVLMWGGHQGALSGDYFFEEKEGLIKITYRISHGAYGLTPVQVRFPEGATTSEMADILSAHIADFDAEEFVRLTEGKEGFLFPDTYLFLPNVKPVQVVSELEKTLADKLEKMGDTLARADKSIEDIIIMASILEKEAMTLEDKKKVSGILWKRMAIGMPLQVDAPFIYERNKNTFELTTEDLVEDSPYNTYTNKGLPPSAICNPGLDSIVAALEPTDTDFLFYLSDTEGMMHYAENYKTHLFYKNKYLY